MSRGPSHKTRARALGERTSAPARESLKIIHRHSDEAKRIAAEVELEMQAKRKRAPAEVRRGRGRQTAQIDGWSARYAEHRAAVRKALGQLGEATVEAIAPHAELKSATTRRALGELRVSGAARVVRTEGRKNVWALAATEPEASPPEVAAIAEAELEVDSSTADGATSSPPLAEPPPTPPTPPTPTPEAEQAPEEEPVQRPTPPEISAPSLSKGQARALVALRVLGRATARELSTRLDSTPTWASRLLGQLAQAGCVEPCGHGGPASRPATVWTETELGAGLDLRGLDVVRANVRDQFTTALDRCGGHRVLTEDLAAAMDCSATWLANVGARLAEAGVVSREREHGAKPYRWSLVAPGEEPVAEMLPMAPEPVSQNRKLLQDAVADLGPVRVTVAERIEHVSQVVVLEGSPDDVALYLELLRQPARELRGFLEAQRDAVWRPA